MFGLLWPRESEEGTLFATGWKPRESLTATRRGEPK
jgi:hypothetical protein